MRIIYDRQPLQSIHCGEREEEGQEEVLESDTNLSDLLTQYPDLSSTLQGHTGEEGSNKPNPAHLPPPSHRGHLPCAKLAQQPLESSDLLGGGAELTPKLELLFLEFLDITLASLEKWNGC